MKRNTWVVILQLVVGVALVGWFSWRTVTGYESNTTPRQFVPADVRASARSQPGGYRSFHFWHVGYGGYRGGK
jgi:hypothetical protein